MYHKRARILIVQEGDPEHSAAVAILRWSMRRRSRPAGAGKDHPDCRKSCRLAAHRHPGQTPQSQSTPLRVGKPSAKRGASEA
jgi:hypothetical protein